MPRSAAPRTRRPRWPTPVHHATGVTRKARRRCCSRLSSPHSTVRPASCTSPARTWCLPLPTRTRERNSRASTESRPASSRISSARGSSGRSTTRRTRTRSTRAWRACSEARSSAYRWTSSSSSSTSWARSKRLLLRARSRPRRCLLRRALGRRVQIRHEPRRLLRQARLLSKPLGDLGDLLGRVVGREDRRLRRKVARRNALGSLLEDLERLAGLGVRPVEDRRQLPIVLEREAVQAQMVAALDVRPALRDLVRRDPRRREHLREIGSRQVLDRTRIRDLVDPATDEQVPGQRTSGRVLDHLVDLELVVPGARLEEEVVREVLDEVARGEHVVAVPRPSVRVLREGSLSARDEVLRVPQALDLRERAGARIDS